MDLAETPDQLPNVAVLAALAPGRSVIHGVGITRFHDATAIIDGGTAQPGATLNTHHDHRLGMAFASLGLAVGGIKIEEDAFGGPPEASLPHRRPPWPMEVPSCLVIEVASNPARC